MKLPHPGRRRRRAPEIRAENADGHVRRIDPAGEEGRRVLSAAQAVLRAAPR